MNIEQLIDFCKNRLNDNTLRISDYKADIKKLIRASEKSIKKNKKEERYLQLSLDFDSQETHAKMFLVDSGLIQKETDDLTIDFKNGLKVNLSQLLENYYQQRSR